MPQLDILVLTHWGRDKMADKCSRRQFQIHFLEWNVSISIEISFEFVSKGTINYIPALVQIMAWRRPGDELLSESMVIRLPTHICVTRPWWIKALFFSLVSELWLSSLSVMINLEQSWNSLCIYFMIELNCYYFKNSFHFQVGARK